MASYHLHSPEEEHRRCKMSRGAAAAKTDSISPVCLMFCLPRKALPWMWALLKTATPFNTCLLNFLISKKTCSNSTNFPDKKTPNTSFPQCSRCYKTRTFFLSIRTKTYLVNVSAKECSSFLWTVPLCITFLKTLLK